MAVLRTQIRVDGEFKPSLVYRETVKATKRNLFGREKRING